MVSLTGIRNKVMRKLPQTAMVGDKKIRLPRGSFLNIYRANHKRYDEALGDIARIVQTKYPDCTAIDVGANVGDTAALIRKHRPIPVLCVEGDATVLDLLNANLAELGDGVSVEASYVGPEDKYIDTARINDAGKNASLVGAVSDSASGVRLKSMGEILAAHPDFARAKLLKTDCEGLDFEIISGAVEFIAKAKPVIFFEYAPTFRPEAPKLGLELLRTLLEQGYARFVYYDNFGCFMTVVDAGDWRRLEDLHCYLLANQRNGTVVHYFDICAFHSEDAELADQVRAGEIEPFRP